MPVRGVFGNEHVLPCYPEKLSKPARRRVFADVPEAITAGTDAAEALDRAQDALRVALSSYLDDGRSLPVPSKAKRGQAVIVLPPRVAIKLAIHEAMCEQGVTQARRATYIVVHSESSGENMNQTKLTKTIAIITACFPVLVQAASLPQEVEAFIRDRDLCDHFRGEPHEGSAPEQLKRRSFIRLSLEIYCPGTDRRLAALIERHKHHAGVVARLSKYERKVEGTTCIDNMR